MRNYAYGDLEVATKGFAVERLIGKGSHGRVYIGALEGGKVVAVKKASEGLCLLQDDSRLGNEAEILSSLSTPRIVNLLGVSNDLEGRKVLVMEFMHNGSLEDCLHYTAYPPPWPRRSLMILQIAMAIQALHEASPPIIHRDVKSANILIDSQWNARLADFGLAVRVRSSDEPHVHNDGVVPAGTIGYLDPSYTSPTSLSPKNDIFSFGVLLLEIVSGRRAMDIGMEPPSITEWAVPLIDQDQMAEIYDSRVPIDKNMERVAWSMLKMAKRCVATEEEEQIRPTIREIVTELRTVLDESHRASLWNTIKKIGFRRHRKPTFLHKRQK